MHGEDPAAPIRRGGSGGSLRRDRSFDATLAWLADPYRYISRRCAALGTDLIETRLLLRPTLCMRGAEATRLFYDPQRFVRGKAMFPSLIERERIAALAAAFLDGWEQDVREWAGTQIRLHPVLHRLLARIACDWAGVPLGKAEEALRARQLAALFDHAGARGPGQLASRLSLRSAQGWIAGLVGRARRGEPVFQAESAAGRLAVHRDPGGILPDARIAAVEILNLLRPIVATSVPIVQLAHALAHQPTWRADLAAGEARLSRAFVDEVRRFYPFLPALAARVRDDFEWRGALFAKGRRVLLDLYGTNHHPDWWEQPESFRPERFLGMAPNPWSFIPQGGGSQADGDRSPGERITIALMEAAVEALVRRTRYRLPVQDLRLDMRRMPALPKSRMVIEGARLV